MKIEVVIFKNTLTPGGEDNREQEGVKGNGRGLECMSEEGS